MAAMMTSGLMFFSRLICSICCRSWLAMRLVPREFHFQATVRDPGEGDARDLTLLLQGDGDDPVLDRGEASRPVPAAVHQFVARDWGQATEEPLVVGLGL